MTGANPNSAASTDAAGGAGVQVQMLDLAAGLPLIERILAAGGVSSHGCDPVWLAHWAANVKSTIGVFVFSHDGEPVFALPVEFVSRAGRTVGRFVGGSHANANFPVMRRALDAAETAAMLAGLKAAVRAAPWRADCLHLERQLAEMSGIANPLLAEGSTVSPNVALSVSVDMPFEALLEQKSGKRKRKRFRSAQRKFEAAGDFRVIDPVPQAEAPQRLGSYLAMKASQFKRKGVANAFGNACEQAFFTALFENAKPDDRHYFYLSALDAAGVTRTVLGSSRHKGTQSVHFMAFANDDLASASPGDFLNHALIEKACGDDTKVYDLGVGDEPYKRSWCDIETWHRDVVIGLTVMGWLYARQIVLVQAAKRRIKNSKPLWDMVKRGRAMIAGDTKAAAAPQAAED